MTTLADGFCPFLSAKLSTTAAPPLLIQKAHVFFWMKTPRFLFSRFLICGAAVPFCAAARYGPLCVFLLSLKQTCVEVRLCHNFNQILRVCVEKHTCNIARSQVFADAYYIYCTCHKGDQHFSQPKANRSASQCSSLSVS